MAGKWLSMLNEVAPALTRVRVIQVLLGHAKLETTTLPIRTRQ